MPLTEKERLTQQKYDASAESWLEHSGGKDRPCFWNKEMNKFFPLLTGDRKVLEVGCGPATDGKYLIEKGIECISTDYSSGMLKLAQELKTNNQLLQMDIQDLAFADNSFDGFWTTACLLHLENPEKAINELLRVTKNEGIGFITIKEGDGEFVDPRTGYYFRYYKHSDFVRKLRHFGLETFDSGKKAGTPNHDWLTYLVRVNK